MAAAVAAVAAAATSVAVAVDALILVMHRQLGNKRAAIAARLDGRTDNHVKNYFNASLRIGGGGGW